mmetsp:Transcript_11821/g.30188  ORF Transcript_11821/g.30188 Transcript_11821/m.30188 type:complete len:1140 (+) Transcript_11821:170-3589(+)
MVSSNASSAGYHYFTRWARLVAAGSKQATKTALSGESVASPSLASTAGRPLPHVGPKHGWLRGSRFSQLGVRHFAAGGVVEPNPEPEAEPVVRRRGKAKKTAGRELVEDLYGALSLEPAGVDASLPGAGGNVFVNVDGQRHEDGRYRTFISKIKSEGIVPENRIVSDPVRTFAYGTDASFYRLNPKYVVKVSNEDEVRRLLPIARDLGVPVTFRAAGTSLSGQAITDSVLVKLSHGGRAFRSYKIENDGKEIMVEPGLIGGEVNRLLARYKHLHKKPDQYKIGPDPASIDSCMIGGIVSNNSSGMCCGVAKNSYHTVKNLRVVLVDGTVLDTSDPSSVESFKKTHASLLKSVSDLARRVQADTALTAHIKKKFAIKCTTGYSINALVDAPVDDPIEILKKLMIGSEGTLAFVSRVTFETVPEYPDKASAFILFPDIEIACEAASKLRASTEVSAVELFDRASLRGFEEDDEMVRLVKGLNDCGPTAASLLIECAGETDAALDERINDVVNLFKQYPCLTIGPTSDGGKQAKGQLSVDDYPFTKKADEYSVYWNARKGLIPIVGSERQTGTSMLIEDVACSVENLGKMSKDLIAMFEKYDYNDATLFGHALEGNLHLVFSQGFRSAAEIERFDAMMQEMADIVADKYKGSMKAEHGTGRNVAPFVEMEWGTRAYELMWELKRIFDPDNVLNPGVILNEDPEVHMKSLKQSPPAHDIVNKCIECGFCESNCPSRDLTLTPRQRITVYREISRLKAKPARTAVEEERLVQMTEAFDYYGNATCAADGMCQEKCPVKINTGELIKSLRAEEMSDKANASAMLVAKNFGFVNATVPTLLNTVNVAHGVLGASMLESVSKLLNKWTGSFMPVWNKHMPKGAAKLNREGCMSSPEETDNARNSVVYLPSCVTRMMGPSRLDSVEGSNHEMMLSILRKAGYNVIIPDGIDSACCGMIFDSRGNNAAANYKAQDLESTLKEVSLGGRIPIICDTSPCTQTIKNKLQDKMLGFSLYEPVEFINHFLTDRLEFSKVKSDVAIHVPCSSKKMGVETSFRKLASLCAENVHESGIPCCGMAGDRGMRYTELTESSLQHLDIPEGCCDGYSTSRTCEMSLSNQSGINFRGLLYLVDEATRPKADTGKQKGLHK